MLPCSKQPQFVTNKLLYHMNMGVSKNSGTPKWINFIMENPIKMDDLGVPIFLETPICSYTIRLYIKPFMFFVACQS